MKSFLFIVPALASGVNPVDQVLTLLQKLYDTVVSDGEVEQKQFEEFAEWCEDNAKERQFEIKTGNSQIESLKATIEKSKADIEAASSRINDITQNISANEGDLKAATDIRNKEHATFKGEEKELVETVDTLRRAQQVLSRELKKGTSFAQLPQALKDLTSSLSVIMDAAIFSSTDKSKLQAFLQQGEDGVNAPEAAAYESHSSGILDTLADLQEKAEGSLSEARKTEVSARHAYELVAQSLNDEVKIQKDALSSTKKQLSASTEVKSTAEGDLASTTKDRDEDEVSEKELARNCQKKAVDFEISTKSRTEELNALKDAKKIIAEATGGATERQYAFIQLKMSARAKAKSDLYDQVEKKIKVLGRKDNSSMLVQLAGQIRAAVSMDEDPFAKVKGLIKDMVQRLLKEAAEEASHKAFCDKETSENEAKRNKLQAEENKLSTRIEKATADVATLKQQVSELNAALANIANSQQTMDVLRAKEHEEFVKAHADFQQGVEGIRSALKILREYFQTEGASFIQQQPTTSTHASSSDSATGIISILEIAESDFSRSVAEAQASEEDAVDIYEKTTQENQVSTATKRAAVEGKTQEAARLEKAIADASSDREGVQQELSAVMEYLKKLRPQCTTEPESYEDRKARREKEIEGLKDALNILENETAFVQEDKPAKSAFLARGQLAIA